VLTFLSATRAGRFVYDLYDSMHRDFALHLAIASEGKQNCAERREASTDRNADKTLSWALQPSASSEMGATEQRT
jgi:hypothetical protein